MISRPCRRCRKNAGETNLTAPLVRTKPRAHGEQSALPLTARADAAASTASPARENDDTRSPLKIKPGWATHTTNPNFGKVEYFRTDSLTTPQVFCPSGASFAGGSLLPRAAPQILRALLDIE